ncbi:acyl-CoA dehydrogenase, putative [Perkinsus marinus ATCC 50983]|uniref:Acyl-CoA dehydrogenase, putative n=1 Tax=Perkinsus marinus (strain ATCC 50983 / TXsc) TaxID=423536 RepID=C5KKD8_PERM5|nr:acyl-CoA dehydrogenase, putative [Perkinsus marinus ATCC 50983]EER15050.1 acyl-CoA dehydrogenase, putative [Perkinsus marinus ATCC 50983]|eukprot:XP_002783254.1 acyl-CoA dehydrogenase, putative [Perkinsus marinus ATCC 50983]
MAPSISGGDASDADAREASITAQPGWYWDWDFPKHHPYLNESHHEFRRLIRAFILEHIIPFIPQWEAEGKFPRELHRKAYQSGVYAPLWPTSIGGTPPPLCKGNPERPGPHEVDIWHDLIINDELANCGAGGVIASCFVSLAIGLPPLLAGGLAGGPELTSRLAREIVQGDKILALAVTEPYAGSDVANIQTTAVLQPDGKHYLVNGMKTFITSGPWADYFTTAVHIAGDSGLSLLMIDRTLPGVATTRLSTQGWKSSGTARITFEDVKVPIEMLIGRRGHGFKAIMHNFNHERLMLALQSCRHARICMEDAIRYAKTRRTFGKRLIDHQVIRHKIAEMARRVLATHYYIENIAIQWPQSSQSELAGKVALLKVQATKTFEFCAREASQVLGGRSYLQGSGPGARIERLYREVRVNAIGGGSEEIMLDLAARQARL